MAYSPVSVILATLCLLWLSAGPVGCLKAGENHKDFSSTTCKNMVCEQAYEQAKGLSKLAILDEFVSQTVFLLKDLMQNIDGELERAASSLLRYIHPNCEETRDILQEVIEKQKKEKEDEEDLFSPPQMGEGVDPMTDEASTDYYTEAGSNSGGYGGPDFSQSSLNPDLDARGSHHDTSPRRPTNGHTGGGQFTTEQKKRGGGSSGSKESGRGDKFGRGWESQAKQPKKIDWKTSDNWKGSQTWGHQEREEEGEYGYKKQGTGSRGNGKAIQNKKHSQESGSKKQDKEGCRGVDKGTPFWVSGLDQWCRENCSKGYCPKTHCIC